MEYLFSLADRLFDVPLMERIRIEAIEDRTTLALKDGSLVSLIRMDGSQKMPGRGDLTEDARAIRIALSPFLSRPGHALEICFGRDPQAADRLVERSVDRCRTRAEQLGLELDGLLAERNRRLAGNHAAETCLVAVHTGPLDLVADGGAAGRRNGSGTQDERHARHAALTDALCRCLRTRDIAARVLGAIEAVREVRAALYPFTAPWKSAWTPAMDGDLMSGDGKANPRNSGSPSAVPGNMTTGWAPGLDWQLASEDAELVDQRIVRIGDALFAAFDVTVAPEVLKPFNELVDAVTAAPAPLPWRCSFLLEPGGLQAVRMKEQFAKLFAFAAPVRNSRIRDAVAGLREIDGSEDTVVKLKMSFATWAGVECEAELRRNAAVLRRAAEQWGNLSTDGASADPVATVLSSAVALAPDSTAPAAAAPLSHALAMLPLGRQAGPWDDGAVMFRTDDGKQWPYQPGSSRQNSWVEIYSGTSGSGKSVAMNAVSLATVLSGQAAESGAAELPRIAIIDIGYSSQGLVNLLRGALPAARRHEVAHLQLRMTPDCAINPFDTPPGMRAPLPAARSFLVNLLSVLTGAGSGGGHCPMIGLLGAVIDQAYRQSSDEEHPKRYVGDDEPAVDEALRETGIADGRFPTWWEAADALFRRGKLRDAAIAQSRAVPALADLIEASHADHIASLYRDTCAADGREPVLQVLRRTVSEAVRDLPVMAGVTRFDPSSARIAALDLEEVVVAQGGAASQRQASLMFMLARQLMIRDWLTDAGEAARAVQGGTLPVEYLEFHEQRAAMSRRTPKLFCMDEFHRCGGLPGFRRQILQDIREGRKNNVRIALSSQVVDDFGDDILEAASTVFIFDAPAERSVDRFAHLFGLGSHERAMIRTRLTGPGRNGTPLFAIIRHKGGICRQKLNLTIGAAELWALSTTPEDVALRERLREETGASDALLLLAARFPGGSAKAEIESRAIGSLEAGNSGRGEELRQGAIEKLAADLARCFRNDLRSA